MHHEALLDRLALALVPGLGSLPIARLLERFGDPGEIARSVPLDRVSEVDGIGPRTREAWAAIRPTLAERAEREVERVAAAGYRLAGPDDPEYPLLWHGLADPPLLLWIRGRLPQTPLRVAIVGSRRATAAGRRTAEALGADLARRGLEVVSGGARGIDAAGHRGALGAGGTTVAVLGSGLARPYPAEHGDLFDAIAERGAVVSEFPLEAPPLPEHFPRRNRLISGLSIGVVVVEAGLRSGSLHTAAHALEQGREVFAVPGPLESDQSAGCHRLIRAGATFTRHAGDVVEQLPASYREELGAAAASGENPLEDDAGADERSVMRLLRGPGGAALDDLAARFPAGTGRLHAALLGLELRGAVERSGGRYYLARPRKEL